MEQIRYYYKNKWCSIEAIKKLCSSIIKNSIPITREIFGKIDELVEYTRVDIDNWTYLEELIYDDTDKQFNKSNENIENK